MRLLSLTQLALALLCCGAQAQDLTTLNADARALTSALTQQLGGALKKELAERGPGGAIEVCRSLAPSIATQLSNQHGVKVARVSLKPRNPLLGWADAWEQTVLAQFDRQAAAADKPETMEHGEIVDEPAGKFFRYMKALPTQPMCLGCHGDAAALPDDVKQQLAKNYPADRAVGYSAGQIRGAVSIKKPL